MNPYPVLIGIIVLGFAGCSTPTTGLQFVPSSTVFRVEPQPVTDGEFQAAEQRGCLVAATGRGVAFGLDDVPIRVREGERLHVLRVHPVTGEVLVRRLDEHTLARLDLEGVEVRATTYPEQSSARTAVQ